MVPILISAAADLQDDAKPFFMVVTYTAPASFMTPTGCQTNAMAHGPGTTDSSTV